MFESILVFVLVLGLLILVHELGHFLVAKKIGIYVHKFSLGFGPKLFGFKGKETEYVIAPIFLGGFVKMAGEVPQEEQQGLSAEEKDQLSADSAIPADRQFFNRTAGERIAVVAAGPLTNYLLGILVFSLIFMIGIPTPVSRAGKVVAGFPADLAGIKDGDLITAINNQAVWRWQDMAAVIQKSAGRQIQLEVERGGEKLHFELTPVKDKIVTPVETVELGRIGIQPSENPEDFRTEYYNPLHALGLGTKKAWEVTTDFFYGLTIFFRGKIAPTEMVAGPIGIYKFGEKMAHLGIRQFLFFIGLISINLAILNLFPVPVLDGGQIMFFLVEKLRGKPLAIRTREIAQQVGLALLMLLMAFAFYSDLVRSY